MSVKRLYVAVIGADMMQIYQTELAAGIMEKCKEYDINVAFFSSFIQEKDDLPENELGESDIFSLINYDKFDAIIYIPNLIKMSEVRKKLDKRLQLCKCPVVVIDDVIEPFYSVLADDFTTIKDITNHFIRKHGFTQLDMITGPKGSYAGETRLAGFCEALRENGIPFERERCHYGDFWTVEPKKFVDEILHSPLTFPQVIVCANDIMAITITDYLTEKGITIPDEVCISGYDNIDEATVHIPQITTADTKSDDLGAAAVELVNALCSGKAMPKSTYVNGSIVFSESCGCGKQRERQKSAELNYYNKYSRVFDYLANSTYFSEEMLRVSNLDECVKSIDENRYIIEDTNEFYICLNDDWDSLYDGDSPKRGYTEEMLVYYDFNNGRHGKTPYRIKSNDMLPQFFDENDGQKCIYFSPLNFKDKTFGYAAISFGNAMRTYDFKYRTFIRSVNNSLEQIRMRTHLRWALERLDRLAIMDTLTGILNRRGYERSLASMFMTSAKKRQEFLVIMGDLDCLKGINDNYGHAEGDSAIKVIAKAFQSCFTDNEVCARLGGDEFIILGSGHYNKQISDNYVESIYNYLKRYNDTSGKPYTVGISIGVYCGIPDEGMEIQKYIDAADAEMYKNKTLRKQNGMYCKV